MITLLAGSISIGFESIGPFNSIEEVKDYVQSLSSHAEFLELGAFFTLDMQTPEEFKKAIEEASGKEVYSGPKLVKD